MKINWLRPRKPPAAPTEAPAGSGAAPPPTPDARRGHLGTWLDVDVTELGQYPTAIDQIYDGAIDGMTIRHVFTADEMSTALERVRTHLDAGLDHGNVIMLGTPLVGAAADRTEYFNGVPAIDRVIDEAFDQDFVSRVGDVLSLCASGRPSAIPEEVGKGRYAPATFRFLPPDRGVMHAHTANEFCNVWDAYSHLREIARMWNSLSYFVVAQAPDEGGELMLYDLMWDDTPDDIRSLSMSPERDELLGRYPTTPVSPGAGDMILFTGGRIWHRVAPVMGATERVTVGGFVALAQDESSVLLWS